MGQRAGSAVLPLHDGRVPLWLAVRMAALGRVITEAIVLNEGTHGFLSRLSHPFWFQSLGAVMGMDWHSSGITTSVLGALKRGLEPVSNELGLYVCGGRGRHSRQTPHELLVVGEKTGLDGIALGRSSRLVAKVDSVALQDGHQLYLHGMIVARDGEWSVVQQGLNGETKTARRYHWRSSGLKDFVDEPHAAIAGDSQGVVVNLTDRRALPARDAQLSLIARGPDAVVDEYKKVSGHQPPAQAMLPHLVLPGHHEVHADDVVLRRLHGVIAAAHERAPIDFAELLLTPGLGPRTVQSLALVAEVTYGAPYRFTDPARFSFAHGGKDGHPFPVPLTVYDQTLKIYRAAIDAAKLGREEKLEALKRLDAQSRKLEQVVSGPSFDAIMAYEHAHSHQWGGRTVFGEAKPPEKARSSQLVLEG